MLVIVYVFSIEIQIKHTNLVKRTYMVDDTLLYICSA